MKFFFLDITKIEIAKEKDLIHENLVITMETLVITKQDIESVREHVIPHVDNLRPYKQQYQE